MASTIAAVTTGGGGVITTADSSGNLSLLSGATTVVAVTSAGVAVTGTLSSSGASTLTGAITATAGINTPNTFGFKNRIINGGMVIDQRNAGASVSTATLTTVYSVDRWAGFYSANNKYTMQQNAGAITPPVGFTSYLGATSSAATSLAASDYYLLSQRIEGYNIADLGWGTANAKTVTLSFWVRSSLTGTFGGSFLNSAENRSYVFSYSIPVANTWTSISVTVAGDTSGTWLTTNTNGISIYFGLGIGSTSSGTAGVWSGSTYYSVTGATSVVGTNGATFYITGVQLEKGSTATSFDFRDYGRELMMCQRYFETTFDIGTAPANNLGVGVGEVIFSNPDGGGGFAPNMYFYYPYKVTKRAAPTTTFYNCRSATAGTFSGWVAGVRSDTTPSIDSANTQVLNAHTNLASCTLAAGAMTFSSEL
jgi:hypothetical protein